MGQPPSSASNNRSQPDSGSPAVVRESDNLLLNNFSSQPATYVSPPSDVLTLPEDKLKLFFHEHSELFAGRSDWVAPTTVVIAFLIPLVTQASFGDFIISGDAWRAIFLVLMIVALAFSARRALALLIQPSKEHRVNELVDQLKSSMFRNTPDRE